MKDVPIGVLVEPVSKWNPRKEAKAEFEYVDLSAVDNISKTITGSATVTGANAPSRARQLIREGDLLVSTVRPNLNSVAAVPQSMDGATASTGFTVLRPGLGLDGRYLFHWLQSQTFIENMVRRATGASYPAISDQTVKSSPIPLPTIDEQRRIAAILDHADALRTKRRQALAHLDSLTQSIFHEMFGSWNDWTWPHEQARNLGNIQLGRQRSPKYQTGLWTRPYMRVANVHSNHIDVSDVSDVSDVLSMDFGPEDFKSYALEYGDILLNEGQSTELVGRPAMWRNEIENCCFQNTLLRFQPDRSRLDPTFALHVFLELFRHGRFARLSSKTSSVAHLGKQRFATMPLPVPPLELQKRFSSQIENLLEVQQLHDRASAAESELFASFQSRAFRGEL